jgi:(R,R)-butanediol dehydrogenase/meso-butanediol dehydrogenase/diacetyl reductase
MDLNVAAITQPLAVGVHAARRSGARAGDSVVVIGAGAIGSLVLAGLRHLTPDVDIVVMDIDAERLARATRLGADRTVNSQTGEGTLPEHPDLVIEASGAPGQLGAAIHMVRPGGRVLAVGMPADPAEIDGHHLVFNEITLDSSVALVIEDDLRDALEMLATTSIASELLDSVRPLERIAETLDDLTAGKIGGKVLLDPSR